MAFTEREVYQIARAVGLDDEGARVAVAIFRTESWSPGAIGDLHLNPGGSHGPYQFYWLGQLGAFAAWLGVDLPAAGRIANDDPGLAVKWALTGYLGDKIREGQALGIHGAELATYAQKFGQVSILPERSGANFAAVAGIPFDGSHAGDPGSPPANGAGGLLLLALIVVVFVAVTA